MLAGYGNIDPFKKDNSFEVIFYYLDFWIRLYDWWRFQSLPYRSKHKPKFWNIIHLIIKINSKHDWKCIKVLINYDRIAVDPIFQPPEYSKWTGSKKEYIPENVL